MVDQALVTSGFDTEVLLSGRFLAYTLLCSVEAGQLPLEHQVRKAAWEEGGPVEVDVTVHPPTDYQRRYEPHDDASLPAASPDSFTAQLLVGHDSGADLAVTVVVDIVEHLEGRTFTGQHLELLLSLELDYDTDDRGFQHGHRLDVELLGFGGPLIDLIEAINAGEEDGDVIDLEAIVEAVKEEVDRSVPLEIAGARAVQRLEVASLPAHGDHPSALGVYVNLALRDGPEPDAFLGDRGTVADGQNFLRAGTDLAFGTGPDLFDHLGPDLLFRRAEDTGEGDGARRYRYPLRRDPTDEDSEEVGYLTDITVVPADGRLVVKAHGVYTDAPGDPKFVLTLGLTPTLADGVLDWEPDADVDLKLLSSPKFLFGALVLGAVGVIGLLAVQELIAEPIATAMVAKREDDFVDASFLEVIPDRIDVTRRRWDPLYTTVYQIAVLADDLAVTHDGMAWEGRAILDKTIDPDTHAVVRDKRRNAEGTVTHLWYRPRNLRDFEDDLAADPAPGTDRLPYVRPASDPHLIELNMLEVLGRLNVGRVVRAIPYVPKRVHVEEHTVASLLCISSIEIDEERRRLVHDFRTATREEIREEEGDELRAIIAEELEAKLGREPTEEEIEAELDERIDEVVEVAVNVYKLLRLPGELEDVLDTILRLDMEPDQWAEYELLGALAIVDGKQLVQMERPDGSVTPYYRDRPDDDPHDNLLALPRYRPS